MDSIRLIRRGSGRTMGAMKPNRSSVRSLPGWTRPARVAPVRALGCAACVAGLVSCSMPEHGPAPEGPAAQTETGPSVPPGAAPATPTPPTDPASQVSAVMTLADARRVQTEVMDFADDMTVRLAERFLTSEHDDLRIRACDRRHVS